MRSKDSLYFEGCFKMKGGAWDEIILDIKGKALLACKTYLCVDIYYSIYTLIIHCVSCKR